MPYPATNDLAALDETLPIGTLEPVSILDDALRETRRTFKAVIQKEHNSDGTHKTAAIATGMLANNSVTTAKILDANVTLSKLAAGVLVGANLDALGVTAAKLAADAVETAKIKDAAVSAPKLAADAVETAKIKAANVTPDKLGGATAGQLLVGQAGGSFLAKTVTGNLSIDAAGVATITGLPLSKWSDTKASGTKGGTFTQGAWQVRDLQTEDYDASNLGTLAGNQLTLVAGTYFFLIFCPAYDVGWHKARLYNVTDAAVVQYGSSSTDDSPSIIMGVVTIAAAKAFQIEHQCGTTKADDGFGFASNLPGIFEHYTQAFFLKVA